MENLNFLLPATFIRGNSLLETILFPCIIVNLNFYFHLASRIFHITRILLFVHSHILYSTFHFPIFPSVYPFLSDISYIYILSSYFRPFISIYFSLFVGNNFFFSRNWEGYIVNIRASSHVAHYWKHYSRICSRIIVRSTSFSCRVWRLRVMHKFPSHLLSSSCHSIDLIRLPCCEKIWDGKKRGKNKGERENLTGEKVCIRLMYRSVVRI